MERQNLSRSLGWSQKTHRLRPGTTRPSRMSCRALSHSATVPSCRQHIQAGKDPAAARGGGVRAAAGSLHHQSIHSGSAIHFRMSLGAAFLEQTGNPRGHVKTLLIFLSAEMRRDAAGGSRASSSSPNDHTDTGRGLRIRSPRAGDRTRLQIIAGRSDGLSRALDCARAAGWRNCRLPGRHEA